MNLLVHTVATVCSLVLCWGTLSATLWVASRWQPYYETVGSDAVRIIVALIGAGASIVLFAFAWISIGLPLWSGV